LKDHAVSGEQGNYHQTHINKNRDEQECGHEPLEAEFADQRLPDIHI
jgi:hypothetical protein